jgi:hypothetical protein
MSLPDITRHNTRYAVSGLGAPGGTGILSRSFTDLHPETFAGVVVWSGTIEAQYQKAEQRSAPCELTPTTAERVQPVMEALQDLVRAAGTPLSVREVAERCSYTYGIVEVTLRRLAQRGELSVAEQLSADGNGARRWLRVYSVPLTAKGQAA